MKPRRADDYPFYDIPGPIAIVHRGGDAAGAEKENSMVAFESAHKAGIIYAETDTVTTSDGVALALHGAATEQIANGNNKSEGAGLPVIGAVQAMTFREVQKKLRVGGEPIPRLEEVLSSFSDMRFFIDPKTPESVEPLARIINSLKAYDRVSVGGFDYKTTKAVAKLCGGQENLATCYDKRHSLPLLAWKWGITTPVARSYFTRGVATSLQIPHQHASAKIAKRAQEAGIKLIVWPSTPEENDNRTYMERALDQGVYGLMSDHTEELIEAVLAHDQNNRSIRRTNTPVATNDHQERYN